MSAANATKTKVNNMLKIVQRHKAILKVGAMLVMMVLVISNLKAEAQQMFVDDAAVTTYRSFQVETWYGSRESWFLIEVSPIEGFEVGTGIGFDSRKSLEPVNWILETKVVPRNLEEQGWAMGGVAGLLFDFNGDPEEIFVYLPYSRLMLNGDFRLHLNIGFEAVNEEEWEYGLVKGIRGDIGVTDRVTILSEIAAANFKDVFFQGGFRISLLPGLLETDITYGEGFRRMETTPGFNVGIAFTPNRLW